MPLLAAAACYGRHVLILGLITGIALPQLAALMRPWLSVLVAGLLFLAALRIGPRNAFGALRDLPTVTGAALILQMLMPLAAIGLFWATGWLGSAAASFVILMLAAPPISGSPNLALMSGNDPAPALRQLIIGTAMLPLTVIPVFWLTPEFGDVGSVFQAAIRLILIIFGATALAFLIRWLVMPEPDAQAIRALDGLAAIAMAVVVIGLMSAVGPALRENPLSVIGALALVCGFNFIPQVIVASGFAASGRAEQAASAGIVTANRNIALFIAALPAATVEPLLLLIGCYQIPMYLTPALFGGWYRRLGSNTASS